ncbi:MAG TPA: patatin-like phospholipase family protein [Vicinamibacterales bacterium]|nr:patatin-like phospholipase family protein [Vicinamibacterales bacterium]
MPGPASSTPVCIGLVLSGGGLRGAAHLGLLQRLLHHGVRIDVMAGVSAGAIIAAYYAAVGLTIRDMIEEVPTFRGRHIVMHGLTLRSPQPFKPFLRRLCGVIPARLEQLDRASFATLHHGIARLGIVCHDLDRRSPRYFSTGDSSGVRLADAARASAAVPGVLPPKIMTIDGETVRLVDGGVSDSLPIAFARSPQMGATHVIVSDCRNVGAAPPPAGDTLVYLRPRLDGVWPFHAPGSALLESVGRGEAVVTDDVIGRIRHWSQQTALAAAEV